MIHSMKSLGLALVATLALSAVVAASASAQAAHFTAGSNSGKVKITQHPSSTYGGIQLIETSSWLLECHEFSGEIDYAGGSGGSTQITEGTVESVQWNGCFLSGLEASVDFDGCHYTLSSGEWVNPPGHVRSDWEIGPEGCEVTIEEPIFGCVFTIEGSQLFEDALTYTNVQTATREELTVHASASGMKYTANANCPEPGMFENAVYSGTWTAKAFDTGNSPVHLTGIAT